MENYGMWHERFVNYKKDKVVVKKRDRDGGFDKSIIIPTDYYPLKGKFEVFTYLNTSLLPEACYPAVDAVKYKIGHCYTNAKEVAKELRKAGVDAKTYVGWLFVSENQFPLHHCWVVVDGNIVVDLTDDFWMMFSREGAIDQLCGATGARAREYLLDFHKEAKDLPNTERCAPVGIPAPMLLYVGCPCDPEEGVGLFCDLVKKYPRHESLRKVDSSGMNQTQRLFAERGFM